MMDCIDGSKLDLLLHVCTLLGFTSPTLIFFWQGFRQYVIYTKYIDEIKLLPTCHTLPTPAYTEVTVPCDCICRELLRVSLSSRSYARTLTPPPLSPLSSHT